MLHMSPREFWKCTPRKLATLSEVHAEMNNPKQKKKGPLTVDGVPINDIPDSKSKGGVGTPNAFVDQLSFMK